MENKIIIIANIQTDDIDNNYENELNRREYYLQELEVK